MTLAVVVRLGESKVLGALQRIAPHLDAFAAVRTRRMDLVNLVHPGHPHQDERLLEGETPWSPIDGVALVACRDDVETAPDSAGPRRRLIHPDGRTIELSVMRGALQLFIRDPDGDVVVRRRAAAEPTAMLEEVVGEMKSDGFALVR